MNVQFKLVGVDAEEARSLKPGDYKCRIIAVEVVSAGRAREGILVTAQFLREYPRPLDHEA